MKGMNVAKRIVMGFAIVTMLVLMIGGLAAMQLARIQQQAEEALHQLEESRPSGSGDSDTPVAGENPGQGAGRTAPAWQEIADIVRISKAGRILILAGSSIALILGVLLALLVSRSIALPLSRALADLSAYIESLAKGGGQGDLTRLTHAAETLRNAVAGGELQPDGNAGQSKNVDHQEGADS